MLQLKGIKKDYVTGGETVKALKGINLCFRKSEFVSVLGQSGCGKTTLLNIIGGLDKYTEGDLFINGISTKNFKDRHWDNYRNHSVGFVFQSYNLIPHQTVLQNVEIALSLSGVSKRERRKRAKEALEMVGLSDQLKKKPSEMSGGQMQRVAIARAIVNNPDIILADEPTGALDTETSVQVMEILKEISKDRLVIMVTHNPELAQKYSTRIIKMLDGLVTNDSNPLSEQELAESLPKPQKETKKKKQKMPSMSLGTSFSLSLKNLFTKKGRTVLTSFAGSIGIIGIALIFAVSQGMTTYIDVLQEDTLSSYPITLENQSMDISSLLETFIGAAKSSKEHKKDAVYQKSMVYDMVNALNSTKTNKNDLKSFKTFLENELDSNNNNEQLKNAINGISYTYDFDLLVYTENIDGKIIRSDSEELMQEVLLEHFGMDMSTMVDMSQSSGMGGMMGMSGGMKLWQQMLSGENGDPINPLLKKQYDVIYGSWPNSYNEIVLVLDENNELDDMALYSLGLKTKEEIDAMTKAAITQDTIEYEDKKWSYKEICDREFKVILNSDCYTLDKANGIYTDLRETDAGLKYLYDNGITLKVTGIIRPNEDAVSTMLKGSIGYTSMLTEHVIKKAEKSSAIKAQLENKDIDIFTNLPFSENSTNLTDKEKQTEFKKYLGTLTDKEKAETYVKIKCVPATEDVNDFVKSQLKNMEREDIEKTLTPALSAQTGMSEKEMQDYLSSMNDEDIKEIFTTILKEQYKAEYAKNVMAQLSMMPKEQLIMALETEQKKYTTEQCALYYDEVLEFSDSTYDKNMRELGFVDLESPATINIYATTFEDKDVIEATINDYNKDVEELSKITYTDYVGIMMSSITTIINAITYVLIAFVAVSLVVSSIMIGVITLISVQERTKEIGILRALGASKRNVSTMFNAETVIIGFTAGALGVLITYLLCIPINLILHAVTGINNLNAILPLPVAVILVAISVLLTMISGLIPSRSAAKKDPVIALRTE
ncbi:MAG: ABC transporter ATP-binding protein/permease [Ruminococcaceae bacterium]|nr:ABC transporter ATP-binding protein/permease [Oscillospiraceae bacterium]